MISKRLKTLATGLAVSVVAVALQDNAAEAQMTREEQEKEIIRLCEKYDGTLESNWRDFNYIPPNACFVPEKDEECRRSYGETSFFSVESGECEDCFLTTACTELIGLPDDCFELRTLRRFRDNHLARMEGGQAEIDAYYRHAPAIVARIKASSSGRAELCRIYATVIAPSVISVMLGRYKTARAIYVGGMKRLMRTYAA